MVDNYYKNRQDKTIDQCWKSRKILRISRIKLRNHVTIKVWKGMNTYKVNAKGVWKRKTQWLGGTITYKYFGRACTFRSEMDRDI
jgi:hypothetical protein